MDDVLKGNFQPKRPVTSDENKKDSLKEEFRKRALASLGGSMVYVEREILNWDGHE